MNAPASYLLAAAAFACTGFAAGSDPQPSSVATKPVASNRKSLDSVERDAAADDSPRADRQGQPEASFPPT